MDLISQVQQLEQDYREFHSFKKQRPEIANQMIKFNQDLLIACGKIHGLCLWSEGGMKFYEEFISNTVQGQYYAQWRKNRAYSLAHCFEMYKLLNVNLGVKETIGETAYAGIPPVLQEEIDEVLNEVENKCAFVPCSEKIGIDGKLHPVDSDGNFLPLLDENDVYGDGTNVTLEELNEHRRRG